MLANLITLARVLLLFGVTALLYSNGFWGKLLAFFMVIFVVAMDALDGLVARRYNQESELGSVLDIAGDRIVENALWICFAHQQLVSVWVPILVLTRVFLTDSVRSVALAHGMTAFGEHTMMSSRVGHILVASRFSRALYGTLKLLAFTYVIFLIAVMAYTNETVDTFRLQPHGGWMWRVKDILVTLTVVLCLARGVPVIAEGWRRLRPPQAPTQRPA